MRDPGPVCAHLLDVAATALTTLGAASALGAPDVPERTLVLHSPPVADQDLLTVHYAGNSLGLPGQPIVTVPTSPCDMPVTLTYVVTLLRYYPVVDEETQSHPTVADEQPWADLLLAEGAALWNAMDTEVQAALTGVGHPLGNLGATLGPLEAVPPQGFLAGWTLVVTGT